MNRQEALDLVNEYTTNKNLVKHMLAVEAALKTYAKKFGEDEDKWGICGILHDFDYEKMGHDHPSEWGMNILEEKGVDREVIDAVRVHGERDKPEMRTTRLAKALFAVDELTGFIVACALVNPEKLAGVGINSIKKKMKKKEFAKAVNRDDFIRGAEELSVSLDEHLQTVLDAMKGISDELGL